MIRLIDDQARDLANGVENPMRVVDPLSSRQDVLVAEADFEQLQALLRDDLEQRRYAAAAWQNLSHLLKAEPW